ncbi:hypothetical protein PM8797T_00829 [Gimesia maris DSM 8797]|nr:hypothetical protein PM8797T_00829 [Gimesia maris DSM 8797]
MKYQIRAALDSGDILQSGDRNQDKQFTQPVHYSSRLFLIESAFSNQYGDPNGKELRRCVWRRSSNRGVS